jgi:hypothetical protein
MRRPLRLAITLINAFLIIRSVVETRRHTRTAVPAYTFSKPPPSPISRGVGALVTVPHLCGRFNFDC